MRERIWAARGLYWDDPSIVYPTPTQYTRTDVADAREVAAINLGRYFADTANTQQARIKELESALRSILQIPNSDAAQGIMKAFAEDALGASL